MINRRAGLWDRRDVLAVAGAAVGSGAALSLGAGAARAATAPAFPLYKVVADARFAESRAFAAEAARMGQTIAWTRGDVTALWYDELDLLWRDRKAALAGLTGYAAFFCLERLALDRGLRVVFKGEHRRLAAGLASHVIAGPRGLATSPVLSRFSDRAWPAQTARLALASLGAGPKGDPTRASTQAGAGQPPLLISWVLAPKPERRS